MSWFQKISQLGLPDDLYYDMQLLHEEKQLLRAVSTPGSLVKHNKEGWTGTVVEFDEEQLRVLVKNKWTKWYGIAEFTPVMSTTMPPQSPEDYLHNEPDHDYQISWDHETDENVDQGIRNAIEEYTQELNSKLLPKLGIFRSFKVEFVNSLYHEAIAQYISGTYSSPVVVIDVGNTKAYCDSSDGSECGRTIKMSILHELAHAIQEASGVDLDEDQAEDFAVSYYYYGIINEI